MDNMDFRNPRDAFENAIEVGLFSGSAFDANYADNYMYMYSEDGRDFFKNRETRAYVSAVIYS